MRRIDAYRIKRGDNLGSPEFWNARLEDIDLRLAASEDAMRVIDETAARAESAALSRINDVVTPLALEAQQRLTNVATLFEATSTTSATIGEGVHQFEIPEGKRMTFAPLVYLVVFPTGDLSKYMAGRVVSYSQQNGILQIEVTRFVGEGTFDDWQIAPMAFVSELEMLATAASNAANATAEDRLAVSSDKATVSADKATAVSAKNDAVNAKEQAQLSLASFMEIYRGVLEADPEDGEPGHFYFNSTQGVPKVYFDGGWGPLFSVSLGGVLQGEIVATAGQDVFNVGNFTFMNVWLDGQKLSAGTDFTVSSPEVTLNVAATVGQRFSYLGYYATEITDFYTKAASDGRYFPLALKPAVAALNSATDTGGYIVSATTTTNLPSGLSGVDGTLIVYKQSAGFISQTLIVSDGRVYTRTYSGASWSAWVGMLNGTSARQPFAGGVTPTPLEVVMTGTVRPEPGDGAHRYGTNNEAFTLAAPTTNGSYDLLLTNGATAGAVAFSGFAGLSDVGDDLTTTNGDRFLVQVRRINGVSAYYIKAFQ